MELKITKEKVLRAAQSCSEAKNVLKTLFPEVFENQNKYFDFSPLKESHQNFDISGLDDEVQVIDAAHPASMDLRDRGLWLKSRNYDWTLLNYGNGKILYGKKK